MGILYITEYEGLAPIPGGQVGQVPQEPPLVTQLVTFSTHAESAAFNVKTRVVRLHTDAICSYLFGSAPVAAANADARMAAGQTEYHGVPKGASYKVSAVANT